MKLYEFEGGAALLILRRRKMDADAKGKWSTIPFSSIQFSLKKLGFGINSPTALRQFIQSIDKNKEIVSQVDNEGNVILNTEKKNPNLDAALDTDSAPSVDQMASSAVKTNPPKI